LSYARLFVDVKLIGKSNDFSQVNWNF